MGRSVLLVQRVGVLLRAQRAPWSLNLKTAVMMMEEKWARKRHEATTLAQTLQKAILVPQQRQHILQPTQRRTSPLTRKTVDH